MPALHLWGLLVCMVYPFGKFYVSDHEQSDDTEEVTLKEINKGT